MIWSAWCHRSGGFGAIDPVCPHCETTSCVCILCPVVEPTLRSTSRRWDGRRWARMVCCGMPISPAASCTARGHPGTQAAPVQARASAPLLVAQRTSRHCAVTTLTIVIAPALDPGQHHGPEPRPARPRRRRRAHTRRPPPPGSWGPLARRAAWRSLHCSTPHPPDAHTQESQEQGPCTHANDHPHMASHGSSPHRCVCVVVYEIGRLVPHPVYQQFLRRR